ncbi:DNA-binding transcriptional regulator, CsgD family [Flaviramulus basaltis]|uniref:DNA-binding transcriptional regulator, CsgD family n=1 Tax=Flaviramulus basaltis TaxID=369401 RepID=A0A1K2IK58_9FLAO|nr:tetratricopeptide repeat protein [Flaviramulus basaltis]SFZ92796.1 DNA-binding transcriptional regulator, CsgD family [Flaviramulus basaltis]
MKHFTIILFLFFISFNFFSQDDKKLDSLILAYHKLAYSVEKINTAEKIYIYQRERNSESAQYYLHECLKLSKELNLKNEEAKALKNLGNYYVHYHNLDSLRYYFNQSEYEYGILKNKTQLFKVLQAWNRAENLEGNFEVALQLSNKALKTAEELQNGLMLSDAHQQKSTIYLDKGDYKNAINQLINASKALDTLKSKKPLKLAIINVGIGRTETLRDNYKEAIPYITKGIKTFENLNHNKWLAISYMELGNTYYDLKDYTNALLIYKKGLKISETMNWNNFIAPYTSNIGAIYLEEKEFDKALKYFFKSNEISSKHGSINNQIIYLNDVASAYFGKKNYNKSLNYYTQAIHLADSIGSIDNLSDAYLERSETYENLNLIELALSDYKKYHNLKDSIFNSTKSKQIEELKTKYETEKKEQEILLQKNEINLLKQKGEINNLYKILFGIGFLLSLIGFYAVRQKLKRSKAEKEKLDLELDFKRKQLTTHALHLAKKNEVLEGLKQKAEELKSLENSQNGYQQLIRTINFDLQDDNNWENFSKYFQEVHKDFNSKVKQRFPDVTSNELRLMSLLKMNLSSKEIANILNISHEGIKKARYRLRKKLDITTDDSLQDLMISL